MDKAPSKVDINFVEVARGKCDKKWIHAIVCCPLKTHSADISDFPAENVRGTGHKDPPPPPLPPPPSSLPHPNTPQQINAMHTEHEHTGKTEKILLILFVVKYSFYFLKIFFKSWCLDLNVLSSA